jgi:pimeloyl-ACP methyl ester carboxylesterase
MERAGSWENWCQAWCEEGARHGLIGERAEAAGHEITAGEAFARAALCYHFAQFMFFDDLDQKAEATARKLALFARAAPKLSPPSELLSLPFEGGMLKARLRAPSGSAAHLAILVPGSDSTKEEFPALEQHFLTRGLATLSLDGPGQGEGRAFGPLRPDIGGAIAAALDAVRQDQRLSGRAALVGMAFGGHLALRAASGLPSIEAAVSINGFHDLGAMWDAFPQVYRDNMRYALGAADAEDAAIRAKAFTLDGTAPPSAPVLVLHGGKDRIFPPGQADAQGRWAGRAARVEIFPDGNHVCNNIPWLYRPMVADWITDRLRG